MKAGFPFQGTYYRCENKRFVETIVFIPFYGGNQKKLFRHIRFVNDLGFDAFGFDLCFPKRNLRNLFFKKNLFSLWKEQIQSILGHLQEDKILFSFSNPILPTLLAFQEKDRVRAWVCDSGPSGRFFESCLNYLTYHEPVQGPLKSLRRFFWAGVFYFFCIGTKPPQKVWKKHLKSLNQTLPILAIKGQKDLLIPPHHIDAHFHPLRLYIRLHELVLNKSSHLNGLKTESKLYQDKVGIFLRRYARTLKTGLS